MTAQWSGSRRGFVLPLRDLDAERILLAGPLDLRLPPQEVADYILCTQLMLDRKGSIAALDDPVRDLLRRMERAAVRIGLWRLVLGYATTGALDPAVRAELSSALLHAAETHAAVLRAQAAASRATVTREWYR